MITIDVFTDPMMGLSYEHEPVLKKLRKQYGPDVKINYVMAVLVRDVSDFMTADEKALPADEGIARYCQRLADIYRQEIPVGSLPMNMDHLHLFDEHHRSSRPLCLAYAAVKKTAPKQADEFLFRLREATILEDRQTTEAEELLKLVQECGIDAAAYQRALEDGTAEQALAEDLALVRKLGIHGLPAYRIRHGEKAVMLQGLPEYELFVRCIRMLQGE